MTVIKNQIEGNIKSISLFDMKGRDTEHYKLLKSLFKNRKIGPYDIFQGIEDVPLGLSSKKIWDMLQGKGSSKKISKEHFDWLMLNFSSELIQNESPEEEIFQGNKTFQRLGRHYVPLSIETVHRLNVLSSKTNLKPYEFLKLVRKKSPAGLTSAMLQAWLGGKNKCVPKEFLDFVLNEWERVLLSQSEFVDIGDEIREELLFHKIRTGLGQKALLSNAKDIPEGFNPKWINEWLNDRVKSANRVHLNYVLERWRGMPDRGWYNSPVKNRKSHPLMPRVRKTISLAEKISPETRELLRERFSAKKISVAAFLRRFHPETENLTIGIISNWINGRTKRVAKEQLDFVLSRLETLPDATIDAHHELEIREQDRERATINKSSIEEMLYHKNRTGVGGTVLLKTASNIPEGLSANMINSWVSGYVKTAEVRHVVYVIDLWRLIPDKS